MCNIHAIHNRIVKIKTSSKSVCNFKLLITANLKHQQMLIVLPRINKKTKLAGAPALHNQKGVFLQKVSVTLIWRNAKSSIGGSSVSKEALKTEEPGRNLLKKLQSRYMYYISLGTSS